jgi:hypothetical protein
MSIKKLFLVIVVLSILDFIITWIGISKFGFRFEANPLFRSVNSILVGKGITLFIWWLLIWFVKSEGGQRIMKSFLPIVAIIYFLTCVWGIIAIKMGERLTIK